MTMYAYLVRTAREVARPTSNSTNTVNKCTSNLSQKPLKRNLSLWELLAAVESLTTH